ncbi:hypothetical protein RSAG8_13619, partial [Rhizoctonia solani AG-8 WAC10335]
MAIVSRPVIQASELLLVRNAVTAENQSRTVYHEGVPRQGWSYEQMDRRVRHRGKSQAVIEVITIYFYNIINQAQFWGPDEM